MEKRHYDVRSRRSQDTGTWLIETPQFKDWLDRRVSERYRVLLGLGDPGAGKTIAWYAYDVDPGKIAHYLKARF